MINRKKFYDAIRISTLSKLKPLNQTQVNGIEKIFDEWDNGGYTDIRWLAYMLATVYHECDGKMIPIEEYGKGKGRPYGSKIKMSRKPYTTPDKLYYGRGYVQLTWMENYEVMGKLLNIDLLNHPELALDPVISVKILFEGMTKGKSNRGDFTGVSLENYFNSKTDDPVNARKIINGLDKAQQIAGYHREFLKALK